MLCRLVLIALMAAFGLAGTACHTHITPPGPQVVVAPKPKVVVVHPKPGHCHRHRGHRHCHR